MKLKLRILSKEFKHIRVLISEAIFAFILVFLSLGNLDLKHSFGVFDKIGWAKDLGIYLQKNHMKQS